MAPWFGPNTRQQTIPVSKSHPQSHNGSLPPAGPRMHATNMHMNGAPHHVPPRQFPRQHPGAVRAPYPSHPIYCSRTMPPHRFGSRAPLPPPPPSPVSGPATAHQRGPYVPPNPSRTMGLPPPNMMRHPSQMRPYGPPHGMHRMPYAPLSQIHRPPIGPLKAPHSSLIPPTSSSSPMLRQFGGTQYQSPEETTSKSPQPEYDYSGYSPYYAAQTHEDDEGAATESPVEVSDSIMNGRASRDQDAAEILLCLRKISPPAVAVARDEGPSIGNEENEVVANNKSENSIIPKGPVVLPTRLALPEDDNKLNSMHCFLRSDLLELFVVENHRSSKTSSSSSSGRVGLRCLHCAKSRAKHGHFDGEAPMAVFYPKALTELYRLVTSWQRVHLRKCRNLPPSVRATYVARKENDKTRGKTQYWVTSAKALGLVDCTSKAGGLRFSQAPHGIEVNKRREEEKEGIEALQETASIQSSVSSETISTASLSSESSSGFTSSDVLRRATHTVL